VNYWKATGGTNFVGVDGSTNIIHERLLERDFWSADLYDQEVKCRMTDLASILQQAQNIVIKVAFKKKITPEAIVSCLSDMGHKNAKSMPRTILKEIAEGEECVITGHLVNSENHLGRSSIIDLNAPAGNNFRQVDHRTIQWIIYKNVKYSLGNKSTTEELPLKRDK